MDSFLGRIAGHLYRTYGNGLSSLRIIFPSKRARLFFNDALARLVDGPLWQPHYLTVQDLMQQASGMVSGEKIWLITELYTVYSRFHDESFDSFYHWGDMLLSDFDAVDKYMVDARMLFSNVSDLKALEGDYSDLNDSQRRAISRFWRAFGSEPGDTPEKRHFFDIWKTLWPVYSAFGELLAKGNAAYDGMIYRTAARNIKSTDFVFEQGTYVFAGFNALSPCEKILFDHFRTVHNASFFWDYDEHYLDNDVHEAGASLRENLRKYPPTPIPGLTFDNFKRPKNITIVAAPSDSMQSKLATAFLRDIAARDGKGPDKETAVILTDENLLMPVLHSVPPEVGAVNVTMGYPLVYTPAYSLVERLLTLQARKRTDGETCSFHCADVKGIMRHPYVSPLTAKSHPDRGRLFIPQHGLAGEGIMTTIFASVDTSSWEPLAAYITGVIAEILESVGGSGDHAGTSSDRSEFLWIMYDRLMVLSNSLRKCRVELSGTVYSSLVRKLLRNVKVPFEGEPLEGIQVMGILESRNLDFKNVLMLSMSDDNYPGNAVSSSFIPHNLRLAYGLPTADHQQEVYSYYFYRVLQRAQNVSLVYSSRNDEKSSGEQSRFLYQLQYESGHDPKIRNMSLALNIRRGDPRPVAKTGPVYDKLLRAVQTRKLSPTAFYNYVQCPLKFYYSTVAGIRPEADLAEEIDSPLFGTTIHRAMQLLYDPIKGRAGARQLIAALINSPEVERAVGQAVDSEIVSTRGMLGKYGGNIRLVTEIVKRYINGSILPFDVLNAGDIIEDVERLLECQFVVTLPDGNPVTVPFKGLADRIDRAADGTLTVIDYKSGIGSTEFKGVESLFSVQLADNNPAVLQTMFYCHMLSARDGIAVRPALYFVRELSREGYDPMVKDKAMGPVNGFQPYKEKFCAMVRTTLAGIFDRSVPFAPCAEDKPCQWCDFRPICRR